MALTTKHRVLGGTDILLVQGNFVKGQEEAFREAINESLSSGQKHILIDLVQVTSIDSAGIAAIVMAHHSVTVRGLSIELAGHEALFEGHPELESPLRIFEKVPIHTLSYWTRCPRHNVNYENPGGSCSECNKELAKTALEEEAGV